MGDNSADWSRLNQSLYVVTFGAQGERYRGRGCILCLESDHVKEQCTLFTASQKHNSIKRAGREECSLTRDAPSPNRAAVWPVLPGIKATVISRLANTGMCAYSVAVSTGSLGVPGCWPSGRAKRARRNLSLISASGVAGTG